MDDQRFDTLVRAFASGITRRGALGILAGLAGFHVAEAAAAKRRRKRDRDKGASKKKGRQKSSRGQAGAEKKGDKVTICHRTGSAKNPFVVIEVANSAVPAHLAHGDSVVDPDFESDPNNCGGCFIVCDDESLCTTDTCEDGECVFTPSVDCDDDNVCTDDSCDPATGDCINAPVPGRECNDGDQCTENDACDDDGNCAGTPIPGCCVRDEDCPPGEICFEGQCVGDPACEGETCETFTVCGDVEGCVCLSLSGGGPGSPGLCGVGATPCSAVGPCGSDNSCPAGSICVVDSCCPVPSCFPLSEECAPAAAARAASSASDRSGPTFGHR